jgi:hypothetical protein
MTKIGAAELHWAIYYCSVSVSIESASGDYDGERFLLDLFEFVPCQGGARKCISDAWQLTREVIRPCFVTCQRAFKQKGGTLVAEFLQLPKLFLLGTRRFFVVAECFVGFVRRDER